MTVRRFPLRYQVQEMPAPGTVTGHAGLALVLEAFRAWGLRTAAARAFPFKQRRRGYSEAHCLETLVAMLAAGADCVDDVRVLAADAGLLQLWEQEQLPAAETLRTFLRRFHDPVAEAARVPHTAYIPAPTPALAGFAAVQQQLLGAVQERVQCPSATLDVDATVIHCAKQAALPVYDKEGVGYQPLGVWWSEMGLWVRSQFRDGNVPAQTGILPLLQESVAALRALGVTEIAVRSDSAGYQHGVLRYLRRAGIPFAISADLSPELRATLETIPESAWGPVYPDRDGELLREWAEVAYVPNDPAATRTEPPDRYLIERVRPSRQLPLFADGAAFHSYAVVTNRWDLAGAAVLRWAHARCGSIEPAHDVLKNECGGGVLPSRHFGVNAAWWQCVVLTANLLRALTGLTLPGRWERARPKRLRFLLLSLAARVIRHGRVLWLRLPRGHPGTAIFAAARAALL